MPQKCMFYLHVISTCPVSDLSKQGWYVWPLGHVAIQNIQAQRYGRGCAAEIVKNPVGQANLLNLGKPLAHGTTSILLYPFCCGCGIRMHRFSTVFKWCSWMNPPCPALNRSKFLQCALSRYAMHMSAQTHTPLSKAPPRLNLGVGVKV